MLQCRISQNVHSSCVASTVPVFKPKYGAFVLCVVCSMVEALSVQRASKESKQHLNVLSTVVQRLNLYLNNVQAVCCSCGTEEKSIQTETVRKWLVDNFIPFCLLACGTVFISFSFFLSCLAIHVFIRVKRKKFNDILL